MTGIGDTLDEQVADEAALGPELVVLGEAIVPFGRERGQLPGPHADVVVITEEAIADELLHQEVLLGVDVDEIDGVRRRGVGEAERRVA